MSEESHSVSDIQIETFFSKPLKGFVLIYIIIPTTPKKAGRKVMGWLKKN